MSNLPPEWVQILSALLTPTIAAAVAVIALLQWRTAHQKLVLDLFEKRLAVYELVRSAVSVVNTSGKPSREAETNMLQAIKEARFLFGKDVQEYLDNIWRDFCGLNLAIDLMDIEKGEMRKNAVRDSTKHLRAFMHQRVSY